MKRKYSVLALLGIVVVGISLFRGENPLLAGGETDIEYWAVCRDLPANAHWTGANVSADGSRKEIPQKEQCSNTWGPCPSPQSEPFTGEQDSTATCTFECDTGYTWNVSSQVCEIPFKGIFYGSGTITVSDGTTSITIMDRNLGATVAGTGEASYGAYYQRGNNYGFPSSGTVLTSTDQVSTTGSYTSGTFIINNGDWSSNRNDNLRGGSGDTQTNRMGRDADRKGPCATGYHVPSAYERGKLLQTRYNVNSEAIGKILQNTGTGLPYISTGTVGTMFMNDFLLPLAGRRDYRSSTTIYDQGYYASYWSSSPSLAFARYLSFYPPNVTASNDNLRASALSLRCFQNSL